MTDFNKSTILSEESKAKLRKLKIEEDIKDAIEGMDELTKILKDNKENDKQ